MYGFDQVYIRSRNLLVTPDNRWAPVNPLLGGFETGVRTVLLETVLFRELMS
jgi:hypothetical protein